jgi:hypothetical protein
MRILAIVTSLILLSTATIAQTPAPRQEEPSSRQPRAAVPGPNAEPGIPQGEKDKTPNFSAEEHMPRLSHDQVAAVGAKLHNEAGDTIGTVENIVLDREGKVVALVIGIDKLFGLAEDHVEIDWKQVRFERKDAVASFVTPLTKDELRSQAKFTAPKRQPS